MACRRGTTTRAARRRPLPRSLAALLAVLLVGACENDDDGTYLPSPDTASSSPDTAPRPSDAAPPTPFGLVAPAMANDPLVTRIYAAGPEEESVALDAIDWP